MPDEPTTRAGDAEASSATFRGGVERVERTPDAPPERPSDVTPTPTEPSPGQPTDRTPGQPAEPTSPEQISPDRPSPGPTSPARPSGVPPIPPRQPVARPPADAAADPAAPSPVAASARPGRVRARKVHRIVRHIEPWSVLKISLLFYAALFLIVCVASVILWGAARSSGTVDNVESFITSVGGFGNCEPIDGAAPAVTTTTSVPASAPTAPVDQIDPGGTEVPTTLPGGPAPDPSDDEDCRPGEELVGEFRFEDVRIFQAFALGGIVLVLAGSAANVVMVLLFNLMSDLTGGVRVTVLEEDGPARAAPGSGSPATRRRG